MELNLKKIENQFFMELDRRGDEVDLKLKKKQGLFLTLLCFDVFIKWTKCFQKGCNNTTILREFCIFVVLFDITVAV